MVGKIEILCKSIIIKLQCNGEECVLLGKCVCLSCLVVRVIPADSGCAPLAHVLEDFCPRDTICLERCTFACHRFQSQVVFYRLEGWKTTSLRQ